MKVNKSEVVLDFQGGYYSMAELAEIHGCTRQRIHQIVDDCIPDRPRGPSQSGARTYGKRILDRWRAGATFTEIATEFGVTKGVVSGVIFRHRKNSQ